MPGNGPPSVNCPVSELSESPPVPVPRPPRRWPRTGAMPPTPPVPRRRRAGCSPRRPARRRHRPPAPGLRLAVRLGHAEDVHHIAGANDIQHGAVGQAQGNHPGASGPAFRPASRGPSTRASVSTSPRRTGPASVAPASRSISGSAAVGKRHRRVTLQADVVGPRGSLQGRQIRGHDQRHRCRRRPGPAAGPSPLPAALERLPPAAGPATYVRSRAGPPGRCVRAEWDSVNRPCGHANAANPSAGFGEWVGCGWTVSWCWRAAGVLDFEVLGAVLLVPRTRTNSRIRWNPRTWRFGADFSGADFSEAVSDPDPLDPEEELFCASRLSVR